MKWNALRTVLFVWRVCVFSVCVCVCVTQILYQRSDKNSPKDRAIVLMVVIEVNQIMIILYSVSMVLGLALGSWLARN